MVMIYKYDYGIYGIYGIYDSFCDLSLAPLKGSKKIVEELLGKYGEELLSSGQDGIVFGHLFLP